MGARAFRHQRDGDAILREFPGGQACALKPRARLVGEDTLDPARCIAGAHDPERGPVTAGRKGTRIAMRQNGT